MFTKVLCCVDGSEHSLKAANAACELAEKFGGTITFLTVAKELKPTEEVKRFMQIEHLSGQPQYIVDDYTQNIIDEAKKIARERGIANFKAEMRSGHPARTIIEFAKTQKHDCIVMGSRGLGDLEGVLLGSVSHKVNSLATCTVVTVKN